MNNKTTSAFILFFVFPCIFLSLLAGMLFPVYNRSSNIVKLKYGEVHPTSPPLGYSKLNLGFSKHDLQDTRYTLTLNLKANCNQTVNVTYAFYQPEHEYYLTMTMNMLRNESLDETFGTESFDSFYFGWGIFSNITLHPMHYDPAAFPLDVYETPDIIIAFDTEESNSTYRFIMDSLNLDSAIPSGFSCTISNFRKLTEDDILSQLGNDSRLENSLALKFRITMLRSSQTLPWLTLYLSIPLLGIWCIFNVTQFCSKDIQDRMKIFAGALLAIFAYLLSIRDFSPPVLTRSEVLIVELIGIWAFIELCRGFLTILRENYDFKESKLLRKALQFRFAFVWFFLMLIMSTLIYINSFVYPNLKEMLVASPETPWGVLTSFVVHNDVEHLLFNMVGLLVFLLLFSFANSFLSKEEIEKRISFLLIVTSLVAMTANLIWIALVPHAATTGASGLVFGFEGVTIALSLLNGFNLVDIGKYEGKKKKQLLIFYVFNLVVFVGFFLQIVLTTELFLGVAPLVNAVVHGVSFLGCFITAILAYVGKWRIFQGA